MDNDTESFELEENPNFSYSSSRERKSSTRNRIVLVIVVVISLLILLIAIGLIAQLSNKVEADREENDKLKSELETKINQTRMEMEEMWGVHAEKAKLKTKPETKINQTRIDMNGMTGFLAENTKLKTELESKINQVRIDMTRKFQLIQAQLLKADGWFSGSGETYYKKFYQRWSYTKSKAKCEKLGAHLLSKAIRKVEEIEYMLEEGFLNRHHQEDIWIGFTDIEEEGNWKWVDGGPTNNETIQWLPNQPDDWKTGEHCGEVRRMNGTVLLLNDGDCNTDYYRFICEKTVD